MDIDDLTNLLDSSLVSDPHEEYLKLLKSQEFSLNDLLLAYKTVINSSNIRYQRYLKYISFNEESFFIKQKIDEFFTTDDEITKVILVQQIDKMIIDFIGTPLS